MLDRFYQTPIPLLAQLREKRIGYRQHEIDTSHDLYAETMIDVRSVGIAGDNYYNRADNPPYHHRIPGANPDLLLRKSVVDKLQKIEARLKASGLSLYVFDAYRPTAVQAYFYNQWMPDRIRKSHPDWTDQQIMQEVEQYFAQPTEDESSPAPHLTGAAVDLTLVRRQRNESLFMGSIFDDVTALAHTDYFETHPIDSYSAEEAQRNRRLLYWVMTEAGFASHPNEWWHYSWGDQLWARLQDKDAAFYGAASVPA